MKVYLKREMEYMHIDNRPFVVLSILTLRKSVGQKYPLIVTSVTRAMNNRDLYMCYILIYVS